MATKKPASSLPTELRTERLILRQADIDSDIDCVRLNTIRINAANGDRPEVKTNVAAATRQIRYKNKVHGPSAELCTLSEPPLNIYWLSWLANEDETQDDDEDSNLVGLVGMSFRPGMPCPDLGYAVMARHHGKGYASEAGREVLRYWRDLVGVREIFAGIPTDNKASRRCAEKIGLVYGGGLIFEFGKPPDVHRADDVAYVLPGMQWREGLVARPADGWPEEEEEEHVKEIE